MLSIKLMNKALKFTATHKNVPNIDPINTTTTITGQIFNTSFVMLFVMLSGVIFFTSRTDPGLIATKIN